MAAREGTKLYVLGPPRAAHFLGNEIMKSEDIRYRAGLAWVGGWKESAQRLEVEAALVEFQERIGKFSSSSGTALTRREPTDGRYPGEKKRIKGGRSKYKGFQRSLDHDFSDS